ncbi:hypothetical protein KJ632_03425 [Patescibacteria group bacterium]|nr:hypothetical protein [Patescibacteria group bacterium]
MDLNRKLKQILGNSGLSEDEIAFYLNILKNPNSTIYDLSKRTAIPKDRGYRITEKLIDEKLINAEGNRQKRLTAAKLNGYIDGLMSQGREFYKNAERLREIKPFLKIMENSEENQSIETFSEEEIGEKFVDLSYLNWDKILSYGNFEMGIEKMGIDTDQQFVQRRMKKGRGCFPVFANPGKLSWNIIDNDEKEMRKTKIIYNQKLSDYFVIILPEANTTALWIKDENNKVRGAVIKSSMLTKLHSGLYDHFWEAAKFTKLRKIEK